VYVPASATFASDAFVASPSCEEAWSADSGLGVTTLGVENMSGETGGCGAATALSSIVCARRYHAGTPTDAATMSIDAIPTATHCRRLTASVVDGANATESSASDLNSSNNGEDASA